MGAGRLGEIAWPFVKLKTGIYGFVLKLMCFRADTVRANAC